MCPYDGGTKSENVPVPLHSALINTIISPLLMLEPEIWVEPPKAYPDREHGDPHALELTSSRRADDWRHRIEAMGASPG